MFVTHPLVSYSAVIAAAAATGVGFATMWSNPERRINRVFFSASLHVAGWLLCRYFAVTGEDLQWMRVTTAVGTLMHFHLWLIKETVAIREERFLHKIFRGRWYLAAGLLLAAVCFTEWFIPTPTDVAEASLRRYGACYYAYLAALITLFLLLCLETIRQFRLQTGVSRLELQLLLFGGSATALVIILLMGIRAVFDAPWIPILVPFVVIIFYTATVVAVTTSRVFNARQIFFVALQKLSLVSIVAAGVYVAGIVFGSVVLSSFILFITVAISLSLAALLNRWFDRKFQFYPQGQAARQAAYSAAQQERRSDNLASAFTTILKGWGQTETAVITSEQKNLGKISGSTLGSDASILEIMRQLRWATPERLSRERRSREKVLLADHMMRNQLGVIVIEEGIALSVLVGVGVGASRRPFTYPQVLQLMELASIIASALERAHFSAKVQHTEQLATVGLLGASLAHEIRNPLVSIKTFVQLLPAHYQDSLFREKFFKLIGDEVGRIDQLTDQLLDLAAPRVYLAQVVELHALLKASLDLVAAKAAHRQVDLITDFRASPDAAFTDASAAKQVMLNLCFNAIQAIDSQPTNKRWIRIGTRNVGEGIQLAIADSGPGISPEIMPRLFQPFQTTKSNGFGLGLAICSDILANLDATISVDTPQVGQGATFRVTFPCQPSSF
jgi:signal transduction histidine kinase